MKTLKKIGLIVALLVAGSQAGAMTNQVAVNDSDTPSSSFGLKSVINFSKQKPVKILLATAVACASVYGIYKGITWWKNNKNSTQNHSQLSNKKSQKRSFFNHIKNFFKWFFPKNEEEEVEVEVKEKITIIEDEKTKKNNPRTKKNSINTKCTLKNKDLFKHKNWEIFKLDSDPSIIIIPNNGHESELNIVNDQPNKAQKILELINKGKKVIFNLENLTYEDLDQMKKAWEKKQKQKKE